MAYEILSESYGARLPKITATADSTDDLVTMGTNYAEGSTCVIGDKTYALDKVQGWVEPGSGGGGGGGGQFVIHAVLNFDSAKNVWVPTVTESFAEIVAAIESGSDPVIHYAKSFDGEVPVSYSVCTLSSYQPADDPQNTSIDFMDVSVDSGSDQSVTIYNYTFYCDGGVWEYQDDAYTVSRLS